MSGSLLSKYLMGGVVFHQSNPVKEVCCNVYAFLFSCLHLISFYLFSLGISNLPLHQMSFLYKRDGAVQSQSSGPH